MRPANNNNFRANWNLEFQVIRGYEEQMKWLRGRVMASAWWMLPDRDLYLHLSGYSQWWLDELCVKSLNCMWKKLKNRPRSFINTMSYDKLQNGAAVGGKHWYAPYLQNVWFTTHLTNLQMNTVTFLGKLFMSFHAEKLRKIIILTLMSIW